MAPKHGLGAEESVQKRLKTSEPPTSRSTPADLDPTAQNPYRVIYPQKLNPKLKLSRKDQAAHEELIDKASQHVSPFKAAGANRDGELDQLYIVTPTEDWEGMRKYTNFIIQGDSYRNDQYVYVRGESTPAGALEKDKDFWVARILEVRAKNAQHVYALVTWMYWSEELPAPRRKSSDLVSPTSGQRVYHGSHELIASNHMEVLDVLTFAGKADVLHWDEESDSLTSKLYWRQTMHRETNELSNLRKHCTCDGHFNPEVVMQICDNPSCKVWLHEECLIDAILTKAHDSSTRASTDTDGTPQSQSQKTKRIPVWQGKFSAMLKGPDASQSGHTEVVITDLREGNSRSERVACLKCGSFLD